MVSRQNHVSSASLIVRPGQCWKRAPGSNSSKYLPKAITYLRALANTIIVRAYHGNFPLCTFYHLEQHGYFRS